jgi:hypothetical protein
MELEREKYSSYGVWNFGDCAEVTWHLFAQYHEADMPYCLLLQLARTGDLRLYREAELLDRHLLDIPAHGGGYGHPQGTWLHYYTLGPLLFSCITGEPWMKDAVEQSHRNTPPLATRLDTTGIAIWANLDMRLHFPRQQAEHTKALDTAVAHWRELIDPKTSLYKQCDPPLESVHHVPIGLDQHYWFGIVGDAIGRYCETFPESKDDRDRLAKVCRAWMKLYGDAPADVQLNTMWLPGGNAMAYASRFTGDSAFLDFAAKNWVLDSKFHPRYRTGSSSAKNWSAFGHRLTQVFLHDWDKRQHPEKYNQDDREPH